MEPLLASPLVVLFVVLAVGTVLGNVRIAGMSVGPAGALFAGLAVSALLPGVADLVPALIGTLGLTLFAYTIGLAGGPAFFSGLRSAAPLIGAAVLLVAAIAVFAQLVGRAIGLDAAAIAGTYAGALTNTPALAAAVERSGSNAPVVGYSLAYPGGVIGIIVAVAIGQRLAARWPTEEDREPPRPPTYLTAEVTRPGLPPLGALAQQGDEQLVFSRVRRDGVERTPDRTLVPRPGDLLTVIGSARALEQLVERIGHRATADLPLDRSQVDFRRIVLSNPRYAGVSIAELDLGRFDAVAGFVRRGDVDLAARPDLVVELGDRIRVVAPRQRLREVARELGDSERAVVVADPMGFSVGLLLGLAVGAIPLPLPGGTFELGTAAAPLLVGLVLGRTGRSGPLVWQLPYATNQALRQLGALLFLATVGLGAGPDLADALTSGEGWPLLAFGASITAVLAIGVLALGRSFGLGSARLAGTLAGMQTQPGVLAFAIERMESDDRVNLAYALLLPPAFVTKIIAAQVLAGL